MKLLVTDIKFYYTCTLTYPKWRVILLQFLMSKACIRAEAEEWNFFMLPCFWNSGDDFLN